MTSFAPIFSSSFTRIYQNHQENEIYGISPEALYPEISKIDIWQGLDLLRHLLNFKCQSKNYPVINFWFYRIDSSKIFNLYIITNFVTVSEGERYKIILCGRDRKSCVTF